MTVKIIPADLYRDFLKCTILFMDVPDAEMHFVITLCLKKLSLEFTSYYNLRVVLATSIFLTN